MNFVPTPQGEHALFVGALSLVVVLSFFLFITRQEKKFQGGRQDEKH